MFCVVICTLGCATSSKKKTSLEKPLTAEVVPYCATDSLERERSVNTPFAKADKVYDSLLYQRLKPKH